MKVFWEEKVFTNHAPLQADRASATVTVSVNYYWRGSHSIFHDTL